MLRGVPSDPADDIPPAGARFVVMGAYLVDCLVQARRLPVWGDDLEADAMRTAPGGKALNQATVLARHGAQVTALGAVGDDAVGRDLRSVLERDGVDTSAMIVPLGAATSTCLVFAHDDGRNAIVWRVPDELVLTADAVAGARGAIQAADVLLTTIDVPPGTVRAAIRAARTAGTRVVVNPAPLPTDPARTAGIPWHDVDLLVPNEAEARALLTAHDGAGERAAGLPAEHLPRALADVLGAGYVCVTLAERGCAIWDGRREGSYPAVDTTVVDSTAASDAFVPALALHVFAGYDQASAAERALRAAALTIARPGSYESLPTRAELGPVTVR